MTSVERRLLRLFLVGALGLMLLMVGYDIVTPDVGHAARSNRPEVSQGQSMSPQTSTEGPSASSDQKVPVQIWTVMAAGGAAAVFLLLFFVRIALGRVAPPPPQEDAHH